MLEGAIIQKLTTIVGRVFLGAFGAGAAVITYITFFGLSDDEGQAFRSQGIACQREARSLLEEGLSDEAVAKARCAENAFLEAAKRNDARAHFALANLYGDQMFQPLLDADMNLMKRAVVHWCIARRMGEGAARSAPWFAPDSEC